MKSWLIYTETLTIKHQNSAPETFRKKKKQITKPVRFARVKQYSSFSYFDSKDLLMKGPKKPF